MKDKDVGSLAWERVVAGNWHGLAPAERGPLDCAERVVQMVPVAFCGDAAEAHAVAEAIAAAWTRFRARDKNSEGHSLTGAPCLSADPVTASLTNVTLHSSAAVRSGST